MAGTLGSPDTVRVSGFSVDARGEESMEVKSVRIALGDRRHWAPRPYSAPKAGSGAGGGPNSYAAPDTWTT